MANPLRGEAEFAGKTLRFDVNAFCEAEEALGKSMPRILQEMNGDVSFNTIRALVWAGLRRESYRPSLDDVGEILSDSNIPPAKEAIIKAMTAAFGGGRTANPPKQAQ